jgi:hypothetical protein
MNSAAGKYAQVKFSTELQKAKILFQIPVRDEKHIPHYGIYGGCIHIFA